MAERTAFLYEKSSDIFDLEKLLATFENLGLSLEHPVSGIVFRLNCIGDDIISSRQEIASFINKGLEISFQMWFAQDHDLYFRVRTHDNIKVTELGLEGTDNIEREQIKIALIELFQSKLANATGLVLIFDPDGASEDCNWDDIIIRRVNVNLAQFPQREVPDLMIFHKMFEPYIQAFKDYSQDRLLIM